MTRDHPAWDILYRLFRLRRLWLVAMLMPLPGLAFARAMSGGSSPITDVAFLGVAGPLWATGVIGLVIAFPLAPLEILAISLTTTIAVSAFPLVQAFIAAMPGAMGTAVLIVLTTGPLVVVLIFLAVVNLLALLILKAPHMRLRQLTHINTDLSANLVFEAFAYRPASETILHRTGPPDAEGFFDVRSKVLKNRHRGRLEADSRRAHSDLALPEQPELCDFRLRVLEQQPLSQIVMMVSDKRSLPCSAVARIEVIERPGGATLIKDEVHDLFNLPMAVLAWLSDYRRDFFRGALDAIAGQPSVSIRMQPLDTPLAWLARHVARSED